MDPLPRAFYARPAVTVARDILGKVLVRCLDGQTLSARVVEVEAYLGVHDPGSHAFRGPTRRNAVMFGPPGYLYVYLSYGMHRCMNVVTDSESQAGAVLIRAAEPLMGLEVMRRLRGRDRPVDLCSGPGKLCQALGIHLSDNGLDLQGHDLFLADIGDIRSDIAVSTRVGLTAGASLPLRFFLPGSPFVSRGRPSRSSAEKP